VPGRTDEITVTVTSRPAGATVTLDGVERGLTPLTLRVPRHAERRKLEIRHGGYRTLRKGVVWERDIDVDLTLERRGPAAKAAEPAVESAPPAEVRPANLADERY
jgi:PEGA domain